MTYPITTDRPWEPITLGVNGATVDSYWNDKDIIFGQHLGNHTDGWLARDISVEINVTGPPRGGALISYLASGRLLPAKFHPSEGRADFRPRIFELMGTGVGWQQRGSPPRPDGSGGYTYVQVSFQAPVRAVVSGQATLNITVLPAFNAFFYHGVGWRRSQGLPFEIEEDLGSGETARYTMTVEGDPYRHY